MHPMYWAQIGGLATLYVLAALAGLRLDAVSGFASLVWAPSGIALAALILGGRRLWPGAFLGALIANTLTGAPALVASGIATGNALEAAVGAYALIRIARFDPALAKVRDALALIVFAATLSTMISATIGVGSLYSAGLVAADRIADTWRTWWVGDAMGVLLVAPLILIWARAPRITLSGGRRGEAAVLMLVLVAASLIIFIMPASRGGGPLAHAYVFFPLLTWAAIRFEQHGAVTGTVVVSLTAILGIAWRQSAFLQPALHESLFQLQTFMGVAGATFLVLGASIAERERSRKEFRIARDAANSANRAKADFLAVMSHELRTPLNAIAGYADLLSLGVPGPLTEKQTDAVTRIRANQQHLLALIDDVLNFATIEAGSSTLNPASVNVCAMLDSLDALVRPDVAQRELRFSRASCDPAIAVRADPVKLRQILINVIGNAIKFTPPGGRIDLSVSKTGEIVSITVSDTGIGIPPDMIDRVFEPFFQVHAGTTRAYPGVGLGLAISRDFAQAMGGDIQLRSTPGQGCAVTIELTSAGTPSDAAVSA